MDCLELSAGTSHASLAPALGGGVASLTLDGREVLRTWSHSAGRHVDPRDLAEFPMAPWVNRVADGRFRWGRQEVRVADCPGRDPYGLHGIAWRAGWSILEASQTEALLAMHWGGGAGWPFPFRLQRRFSLSPSVLKIEARLTNLGQETMPAAIGFHPYFPSRGARITARTAAAWLSDGHGIPEVLGLRDIAQQMASGIEIDKIGLDNCFVSWDGGARIDWPTHSVTLATTPALPYLQIYSPLRSGYFCLEPQTAMPDALNRDPYQSGLAMLSGNDSIAVTLTMQISPGPVA